MVMVDNSHAAGFAGMGAARRSIAASSAPSTSSLAPRQALGRVSGRYTSGKREFIDWLRQCLRPYLFSTLMPTIAGASLRLIEEGDALRESSMPNASRFRSKGVEVGFTLAGANHGRGDGSHLVRHGWKPEKRRDVWPPKARWRGRRGHPSTNCAGTLGHNEGRRQRPANAS